MVKCKTAWQSANSVALLTAGCGVVALLTGCVGTLHSETVPNTTQQAPRTGAKARPALLYVSDDGKERVLVYSYPSLKRFGTLSGVGSPTGLCVDQKTGAVWVTETGSTSQIIEFAHGGTKPIRTFQDSGGETVEGCAVSPTSDELAVSNATFGGDDPGDLIVYNLRTGKSKTYQDKKMFFFGFVGYDSSGDLFLDGTPLSYNSTFRLDELPSGGNKLINIRWHGPTIEQPGNIQYDGTNLTVGDVNKALVYQTAGGKVFGTTALTGACYAYQYFIDGDKVIAPSNCDKPGTISVYNYPAGGVPIKTIGGFGFAFGAVISR
jgi:hypothetical protein